MPHKARTPKALVDCYIDAVARFEYEAARACLADDGFESTGPINSFSSAEGHMRQVQLATPIVQRIETLKSFAAGSDVAHFLLVHTQLSEKMAVHVAQWAHVRDGRIDRLQVVFDAHWYRSLFPADDDAGEPPATFV